MNSRSTSTVKKKKKKESPSLVFGRKYEREKRERVQLGQRRDLHDKESWK